VARIAEMRMRGAGLYPASRLLDPMAAAGLSSRPMGPAA
jgi:hypothetical protein